MYIQANTKDVLYYYIQRKYNQPSGEKKKEREILSYIQEKYSQVNYILYSYIYKKNTQSPLGENKEEKRYISNKR